MRSSVLCFIFSSIFLFDFVYSAVTLTAAKQDGVQLVTFTVGKNFEIACNAISDNKNDKIEIEWKKDDQSIENVETLKDRYKTSKKGTTYKLEIKHSREDDIGNYTCSVDDEKLEEKIPVFVKPTVKMHSSVNSIELERLKITCTVNGKPRPEVSWLYSNESLDETDVRDLQEVNDRITFEKDPERGVPDAVLIITNVQMYDRGRYTCVATPPHGHRTLNATSMVRIKDKYAALWPFIGICVEVFVLCAIILIYEKKRNKTELEESDTDQSPDQKNTPDHNKDSNLRHRQ